MTTGMAPAPSGPPLWQFYVETQDGLTSIRGPKCIMPQKHAEQDAAYASYACRHFQFVYMYAQRCDLQLKVAERRIRELESRMATLSPPPVVFQVGEHVVRVDDPEIVGTVLKSAPGLLHVQELTIMGAPGRVVFSTPDMWKPVVEPEPEPSSALDAPGDPAVVPDEGPPLMHAAPWHLMAPENEPALRHRSQHWLALRDLAIALTAERDALRTLMHATIPLWASAPDDDKRIHAVYEGTTVSLCKAPCLSRSVETSSRRTPAPHAWRPRSPYTVSLTRHDT